MKDPKWTVSKFDPADIVPIAGDGAIAGPAVEGVLVPVLILDTTNHPAVAEAIRLQASSPAGDVAVQWGKYENEVTLNLRFIRPVSTTVVIRFEFEKYAVIVDTILRARTLYLQAGGPGDRIKHDVDKTKMVVQIGETGFDEAWEEIFLRRKSASYQMSGLKRHKARTAARDELMVIRKFNSFRVPDPTNPHVHHKGIPGAPGPDAKISD